MTDLATGSSGVARPINSHGDFVSHHVDIFRIGSLTAKSAARASDPLADVAAHRRQVTYKVFPRQYAVTCLAVLSQVCGVHVLHSSKALEGNSPSFILDHRRLGE